MGRPVRRCSALGVLYLQEDVAERVLATLTGAMAELRLGDPWLQSTVIAPVIDARAKEAITRHIETARAENRLLNQLAAPPEGHFIGPAILLLPGGIASLGAEVFGPVLHLATYTTCDLERVISDINASGFGLTFGLHSRIDDRVQRVTSRIRAGNLYVNRDQIGAVVGSQPFCGEGPSGTGPTAGGPHDLARLSRATPATPTSWPEERADPEAVAAALARLPDPRGRTCKLLDLPGPTGEANRLSLHPRGRVLCQGPGAEATERQKTLAEAAGRSTLALGARLAPEALRDLAPFDAVILWSDAAGARPYAQAPAAHPGAIIPLITEAASGDRLILERHLCIDTTAAGGNAALLARAR